MLTKIDYSETIDTTFREYSPTKERYEVMYRLRHLKPSEMGMVYSEGVVSRGMKLDSSTRTIEINTIEKWPRQYIKLNIKAQKLLASVKACQDSDTRKAMFIIHKSFMDFGHNEDFQSCDDFLMSLDVSTLDLRIMMAVLMASNPFKSRLSYRQMFYKKVAMQSRQLESFDKVRVLFDKLK